MIGVLRQNFCLRGTSAGIVQNTELQGKKEQGKSSPFIRKTVLNMVRRNHS